MNYDKKKQIIIYIITVVFSILFLFVGNAVCRPPVFDNGDEIYYRAKVVEIKDVIEEEYSLDDGYTMVSSKRIMFDAFIKSGPYKGDTVEVSQDVDNMYAYQPRDVKVGDEVLISRPAYDYSMIEEDISEEEVEWVLIDHNRIGKIAVLVAAFLLLIIIIGRAKGLSTILSLIFTVLAIFMVYIPSILKGYNVYLMTVVVSIFVIFMSLIIINGWNKKTLCAIFGNVMGVAIAGVLAAVVSRAWGLTGVVEEEYVLLSQYDTPIDLLSLVWGGVVIGALGAIMDVAMSIASSMNELNEEMRDKTFGRMLRSGMNIGRDAIGTMTNTLILAYIGGALATVLLLVAYNKNLYYLFNLEMIMAEILSAVVGSIGILAAVPATALFSAYVFNRDKK
ncbi:MAG: YibE/F family protein [Oscillospiraceae bacterium]|nr:YibE/F family protein [Oscillospiraceae bacterium]